MRFGLCLTFQTESTMYYSEKIIDGVLHSKTHPKGKYEPLTPEQLTNQIVELKKQLFDATTGKRLIAWKAVAC